jgi:preprotein translocase subunit Sec63
MPFYATFINMYFQFLKLLIDLILKNKIKKLNKKKSLSKIRQLMYTYVRILVDFTQSNKSLIFLNCIHIFQTLIFYVKFRNATNVRVFPRNY